MIRKDYILLESVYNLQDASGISSDLTKAKEYRGGANAMYFYLLGRIVRALKAQSPKFDADEFMRNLAR